MIKLISFLTVVFIFNCFSAQMLRMTVKIGVQESIKHPVGKTSIKARFRLKVRNSMNDELVGLENVNDKLKLRLKLKVKNLLK